MEADGSPAAAAPSAPQEQQLRRSSSDASSGRSSDSSDGADSASGSEDDESGSDSESSSEDDLSDNETLASRHKKRASAAAEQAVKRRRSSSDTGSGSSSHRRKRRNLFPVIRKSQRCGKCHTCTNPQLKKACLTVREQMMREATKGSKKSKGSAPAAPPAAASSSRPQAGSSSSSSSGDVDKYTDLLLPFINSAGGISDVASVQPFIKAMGSFSSSLARMLPCTVLGLSSAAVLAEFMARGGVDVLSGWMLTALQEDSEQASQFLAEALSALKKLPVTKGFVQGTKSAKVIGALRKHDSSDVRRLSRDVVALWMKAIPAGTKPAGAAASSKPSAAGEQREAALAAAALPAAKRLKTSGQELPTPAAAGGLQQQRLGANGAAARGAAAAAGAGAVSGIHVVSDNDLFKPKTPQRLGMAAKQQKKPGLVQTLDPAEASRLLGGKAAAAGQADAGQQQQQAQPPEPYVQVQIIVNPDPASDTPLKVTLKLLHPLAAAAAAKRAAAAAAAAGGAGSRGPTTSSVSRLPGVRRQFGAGLGARPGAAAAAAGTGEGGGSSSSISALLGGSWVQPGGGSGTAAAAAAAAAAGGAEGAEGGEPAAKRARKGPVKRVAWKAEHELVAVRWFVKEDPPAQACKDAHLTDEQLRALAAAHQHPHAAFDQAARMEHQRERQIIEQQHREAEEAAARLRQQVDAMQPAMEWYGAPPEVPLDPAWQVAAGEDSTEAQRHTRTLPQLLTKLASAPPPLPGEPQESHQLLQPPNALFNVAYHDRNVKIIPLNTVVQQQPEPPPPQQQQQQPVVLQAPLQQQPVPMQQPQQQLQPQPPMLNVQPQPGQYEQPGHVYEQQGHMQHMGRHEYGQQQWDRPQYEGGGGGYRGHGGGHVREDWRRSKRECKFFATAAGCKKGDACTFKHFAIVDGKTMDVRETRR
ncbi:hypothetical protein OEZ86_003801 [Tetradesmus obliquus]|nr:hypothetical protein OEZ86_003801 [Tetradesmus obliquus]